MHSYPLKLVNEALNLIEDKTCRRYAIALNLKGIILVSEWEFDEALKCYNEALKILPDEDTIKENIRTLKKKRKLDDHGVLQYFDQGW